METKKWKEYLLGILRFFMCYRCVFILDSSAPPFDIDVPLYRQQLNKDLVMNVYSNGQWGSYRHLPLDSCSTIPVSHAYVNVTTWGELSSLKWLQGKLQPATYVPNLHKHYFSMWNGHRIQLTAGCSYENYQCMYVAIKVYKCFIGY